jgi:hypothetical protein
VYIDALDISEIREISTSSQNFNDLVLPENTRELVEGLVRTHSKGSKPSFGTPGEAQQLDLVRGKGKSGWKPPQDRGFETHFR